MDVRYALNPVGSLVGRHLLSEPGVGGLEARRWEDHRLSLEEPADLVVRTSDGRSGGDHLGRKDAVVGLDDFAAPMFP